MLVLIVETNTTRRMISMYKSILQFGEKGIANIENIGADFFEIPYVS